MKERMASQRLQSENNLSNKSPLRPHLGGHVNTFAHQANQSLRPSSPLRFRGTTPVQRN